WEKVAVPFHISVDVKGQVLQTVKNQLRNVGGFTWAGYDEAANWCLDNNYELEQALKWSDESIQGEERFDNLETKSRVLEALGRKDEAAATLARAIDKADAIQLYVYARGLQRQGQQDKPFELYKMDAKRYPNHWISHLAMARVDSKAGDFT